MKAEGEVQVLVEARESLSLAMKFHASGEIERAEHYYLEVLQHRYRVPDILPLLAGIATLRGDTNAAITYWNDMLRIEPDHLVALLGKGALLLKQGETNEAIRCFEFAAKASPDNPLVLNNLSVALAQADRNGDALAGFRRVVSLQPDSVMPRHQMRRLTSRIVPFWHIPMLNDVRRNDAFEAAIKRAIAEHGPSVQILDIGAGSGLLSMMAARAGATNVVACEVVPVIAETAERIIEQNGLSNRVSMVNKVSTDLVIGRDMQERAGILVSEILSSDLLAESVLDTFEDAHARLISEGATIIPRAASAIGCLVESDVLGNYAFVGAVSGFDVSEFTRLAANRLPIHGTMTEWRRLSPDIELQTIDLTCPRHAEDIRLIDVPVSADGTAVGIVQWMRIDLAEGIEFSNHPDDYSDGGWLQVLHPFPEPIKVTAGIPLKIIAGHDRNSLILMPASLAAH
ncbi:tetratricopeptide repeat protein [Rhizobium rhizogenes]|uniref:tetratricopeptide repeat protein n=1 Tax=Rhizobium rhizogenes TaxID=359 RepID=UPI001571636A|nr:tetratricopeptide repeat protein [Rhizobium rhizogenes]NTF44097.1 tetratricopeptide repeat protein [Rhizobium rhizogenes]